jgi:hypothetical protein
MEKLPHYNFSWTVSLPNWTCLEEAMDLSRVRQIEEEGIELQIKFLEGELEFGILKQRYERNGCDGFAL